MQPDGMPSVSGMHRTHALCVVRSVDVVWVREPMLTGCDLRLLATARSSHDV